ncbi:MAG: hypothetical protein HMLKMBBP_01278 [Planctomycetes bacterium]|nr:hypothetical protein [Planctomycetota bacterium]
MHPAAASVLPGMRHIPAVALLLLAGLASPGLTLRAEDKPSAAPSDAPPPHLASELTYDLLHTFEVKNVPEGAKSVRIWFWVPEDTTDQKVLEFAVKSAPAGWRFTRDRTNGSRFLYAELDPSKASPRIETAFKFRRRAAGGDVDATKTRPLTPEELASFAPELRTDEKHMSVTETMRKAADNVCGSERNPVIQAQRIVEFVRMKSDHYLVHGPKPKGKCLGDAEECMAGTGDCCTDQHALFIAMARARGIPCRLHFGSRLQEKNLGKAHDPGYRCWVTFFAPGLGWIPLDISASETEPQGPGFWFGRMDARRIEWAEGRGVELSPPPANQQDLVIRAWVEVDGQPWTEKDFERRVTFSYVGR